MGRGRGAGVAGAALPHRSGGGGGVGIGSPGSPGRLSRIDRGWSTVMMTADDNTPTRVRNLFVDVAIGDWIVPSDDGERVEHILERTSAFIRRASFEGDRFVPDTLAANIDVVFLVHSFGK